MKVSLQCLEAHPQLNDDAIGKWSFGDDGMNNILKVEQICCDWICRFSECLLTRVRMSERLTSSPTKSGDEGATEQQGG